MTTKNWTKAVCKLMRPTQGLLLPVLLTAVLSVSCTAQSLQFYGGYSYQRLNPSAGAVSHLNGWDSGAELGLHHLPLLGARLALAADVSGVYTSQGGVNLQQYTYLGGPRVSQKLWRVRTFEHVMIGNAQLYASQGNQSASSSSFSTDIGGGADLKITKHLRLRLLQFDYLLTHHDHNVQNNFRYSSGVVWVPGKFNRGPS